MQTTEQTFLQIIFEHKLSPITARIILTLNKQHKQRLLKQQELLTNRIKFSNKIQNLLQRYLKQRLTTQNHFFDTAIKTQQEKVPS
jgi:hypothetical protein